jgi:hypothetical protein
LHPTEAHSLFEAVQKLCSLTVKILCRVHGLCAWLARLCRHPFALGHFTAFFARGPVLIWQDA